MTRGKIIYIAENKQVYSTIEFNGDMYPVDGGHGEELYEIIPGNPAPAVGLPIQNKLFVLMANMDWNLFVKQKEWLYAQQIHIEKWYDEEAAALPAGILSMMDRIQEAWEEETVRAEANECWYEEKWCDEDLRIALHEAGVDVTAGNVAKLKKECLHVFDDKSERNEILVERARKMRGNV